MRNNDHCPTASFLVHSREERGDWVIGYFSFNRNWYVEVSK